MDALRLEAAKHSRLISKIDGVTCVSEPDLVGKVGWSVVVHISANEDGWQAMRLLKSCWSRHRAPACVRVDHEAVLRMGRAVWKNSESFNDALLEILAVEQWLAKMAGRL